MPSLLASKLALKARLAGSSLEDWPSYLENCRGGKTPPQSRVSRQNLAAESLGRIARFFRTPRGLAGLCICWLLLILALVFGFTLATSWEIPARDFVVSSTAVSLSEKSLDGWMVRKLYCYQPQPCDAWSPFSEDAPFNLRFETRLEKAMTWAT